MKLTDKLVRTTAAAALLLTTALASPVLGQDGAALAAKFGALESVRQISLSPDGNQIAYIAPTGERVSRLFVVDLAGAATPRSILEVNNPLETLNHCRWATNAQIVCTVIVQARTGGDLLGASRQLVISSDGRTLEKLTANTGDRDLYASAYGGEVIDWDLPGKPGKVLMTRMFVPKDNLGTNIQSQGQGIGVEEVDVEKRSRVTVERPRSEAWDYITDGRGNVRIMTILPRDSEGYRRSLLKYSYRKPGSRDWENLSTVRFANGVISTGFEPVAVDPVKNVAYGFDDAKGMTALYSLSLDGAMTRQLVLARDDVDVDQLVQIGRDRRVVGVSYATERREVEYFDPELRKLAASLGKAMPGKPAIGFVDASADEGKLLLVADSDVDPGTMYRFDKATRQLSPLLKVRQELDGMAMGAMRAVSYPAADGTMIPAYLTLPPGSTGKNIPAIVMPHGGPSARDEWGFDWLVQYFAARGFAVLQPNYRGSSGYGAAWYKKNGFQSWQTAVGDVNDAGQWLASQGIAAPGKLGIVGWSYGGYAALQSSVLDPKLFKAIVAIAPVTDLEKLRSDAQMDADYPLVDKQIGTGPHVRAGSPAQQAQAIVAPVLLFHGDLDSNVKIAQSRLMAERLRGAGKSVELIEFPGLAHSLVSAAARTRMLATSDSFLRRNMGLPAN